MLTGHPKNVKIQRLTRTTTNENNTLQQQQNHTSDFQKAIDLQPEVGNRHFFKNDYEYD
jgi:hypothetical protein